jgi:preprotein translocase subunit SecA
MSSWGTSDLLGSASRIADDARRNGRGDDLVPMAFAILCQQMLRADGTFPSAMQIGMAFRMHDGISVSIDHAKRESAILLVAFCEALLGNQVHVISEDMTFLEKASRHASSLLPTFNLSVAQEIRAQNDGEDRRAYGSDVIYGTPLEFGCDYLRNSISGDYSDGTWMRLDVAIVDDAQLLLSKGDSILLSIKGASSEGGNDGYHSVAEIVRNLITSDDPDDESCDIVVDMSRRKVLIRAAGAERIKERVATVGLNRSYDTTDLTRRIQCALQAEYLLARGRDYVVEDGHVILLDPRTGTTMRDRRWSNGLHEAVEAKEGLVVREPGQQLATMTVNEFISLYGKAVAVN